MSRRNTAQRLTLSAPDRVAAMLFATAGVLMGLLVIAQIA